MTPVLPVAIGRRARDSEVPDGVIKGDEFGSGPRPEFEVAPSLRTSELTREEKRRHLQGPPDGYRR
jgi:hypothetical protein